MLIILWAILLVYFPETKNQSSSQISRLFQLPNAWRIPIGFQSSKLLQEIEYCSLIEEGKNENNNSTTIDSSDSNPNSESDGVSP